MKVFAVIILGSLFCSFSSLASCDKHEKKLKTYTNHLKNFKSKSCYYPETKKRVPCTQTGIIEEIKARRLASIALLGACGYKSAF